MRFKIGSFKLMSLFLVVLLIFLQCRLWFQSGGILDMLRLKKKLSQEQQINEELKKRNLLLLNQIKSLQNDGDAIESRARHDLGMVKKGEIFYRVIETNANSNK